MQHMYDVYILYLLYYAANFSNKISDLNVTLTTTFVGNIFSYKSN